MNLLKKRLYLPHLDDPAVLHMGLQKISADQWLYPDLEAADFYRHKCRQFEQHPDRVYRAEETSAEVQAEFRDLLLSYLLENHASLYRRDGNRLLADRLGLTWSLSGTENLWQSALWIADDVCLLQPEGDDYRLTAASLCSPSQWYLGEKIGHSLASIHQPIPGFSSALTPRVTRFFHHLKAEYPVQRFNWSVQPDQRLRWQDPGDEPVPEETELYWRIERQTLRRLPVTGAVAFTIKVYLYPLSELKQQRGALDALASAIDQCPAALKTYKDFDRLGPALRKYFQNQND